MTSSHRPPLPEHGTPGRYQTRARFTCPINIGGIRPAPDVGAEREAQTDRGDALTGVGFHHRRAGPRACRFGEVCAPLRLIPRVLPAQQHFGVVFQAGGRASGAAIDLVLPSPLALDRPFEETSIGKGRRSRAARSRGNSRWDGCRHRDGPGGPVPWCRLRSLSFRPDSAMRKIVEKQICSNAVRDGHNNSRSDLMIENTVDRPAGRVILPPKV